MLSRAHLLIEKEIEKLRSSPPWGIDVEPVNEDNFFEWTARINGLKETLWEGGIFQVYIKFDEHFNATPPDIFFQTIPYHPNVDMHTGRPCVDFLDNWDLWNPSYSLSMLLVTLQALLSNPNQSDAVNLEAMDMLNQSPHSYRQMVLECVSTSQRVAAGENLQELKEAKVKYNQPPQKFPGIKTSPVIVSKINFDDYHLTWRFLATSKPTLATESPLVEIHRQKPQLQKIHMALPKELVEEHLKKQLEEHDNLMFGRFKSRLTATQEREAKLAQVQRMKKIYLPVRHSPTPAPPNEMVLYLDKQGLGKKESEKDVDRTVLDSDKQGLEKEEWEEDVDDLVNWTNKLDTEALDT